MSTDEIKNCSVNSKGYAQEEIMFMFDLILRYNDG